MRRQLIVIWPSYADCGLLLGASLPILLYLITLSALYFCEWGVLSVKNYIYWWWTFTGSTFTGFFEAHLVMHKMDIFCYCFITRCCIYIQLRCVCFSADKWPGYWPYDPCFFFSYWCKLNSCRLLSPLPDSPFDCQMCRTQPGEVLWNSSLLCASGLIRNGWASRLEQKPEAAKFTYRRKKGGFCADGTLGPHQGHCWRCLFARDRPFKMRTQQMGMATLHQSHEFPVNVSLIFSSFVSSPSNYCVLFYCVRGQQNTQIIIKTDIQYIIFIYFLNYFQICF